MRKLLITLTTLLILTACKNEPEKKDYVTLSGNITNATGNELKIINDLNQPIKTITVNEDGTFKDTLKVSKGVYNMFDGNEYAALYLENDFDINITLDTKEFDETLTFTGNGSDGSTYLAKKTLLQEETFTNVNDLYILDKPEFLTALENKKADFVSLKGQYKDLDSTLTVNDSKDTEGLFKFLAGRYDKMSKMAKLKGKPSPKFVNYENHKGGTTSLDDLKGKYVYVDVWATWCGPCKKEIPFLKEVEKEFHGKNIEFVSVSIDKKAAHKVWKQMVTEKELVGIQLFAGDDLQFVNDYGIEGIPRFILIDDKGNVVNADAPRPSNPKLKEVLNGLLN
ncbi:MAG: TlpA family protein disulfide reductase [Flavobacteriaceae bacterium]|nr:TlpA family protein disulfide reductase [Flavobacteriaceae bacterium]